MFDIFFILKWVFYSFEINVIVCIMLYFLKIKYLEKVILISYELIKGLFRIYEV